MPPDAHNRAVEEPTADKEAPSRAEVAALIDDFVAAVWNGDDLDALDRLTTDGFVVHGLGAGRDRDREAFREFHAGLLAAVPDLRHEVTSLVVDGEYAVAFVALSGTPERQYGALSPTGRSFDEVGFQQYRVEDGLVAEVWVLPNAMGMLRQLGILPDGPEDVLRLMARAIRGRLPGG